MGEGLGCGTFVDCIMETFFSVLCPGRKGGEKARGGGGMKILV